MKELPKFKHGETVYWSSQSAGSRKQKVGLVVGVVPAGSRPSRELFPALYAGPGVGMQRDHESYVVRAKIVDETANSRPRLYWPRVSALKAFK